MDQILIGAFIASERKNKGYTQMELAEKLGISNKTISKWETGNGFPEASLLLPLCTELDITVNELLSGEKLAEENYREKAEENMINMIKKKKTSKEERIISGTLTLAIVLVSVAGYILGKRFAHPEAQAAIGILFLATMVCIALIWIAVTITLRKL